MQHRHSGCTEVPLLWLNVQQYCREGDLYHMLLGAVRQILVPIFLSKLAGTGGTKAENIAQTGRSSRQADSVTGSGHAFRRQFRLALFALVGPVNSIDQASHRSVLICGPSLPTPCIRRLSLLFFLHKVKQLTSK